MFGMSRSVQTMTFMPLASVVDCTWSAPGTRAGAAGLAGLVAAPAAARHDQQTQEAESARTTADFDMRHLDRGAHFIRDTRKEKRRTRGKSFAAPKKRTPGKSCSQSFVRSTSGGLPRNLDGVDRRELGAGEPRIDGREHHAATAATLDHHSRHRRPRARDTLRVGKNQRYCGSRHHDVGQSNARASPARSAKSMS